MKKYLGSEIGTAVAVIDGVGGAVPAKRMIGCAGVALAFGNDIIWQSEVSLPGNTTSRSEIQNAYYGLA